MDIRLTSENHKQRLEKLEKEVKKLKKVIEILMKKENENND